MWNFMTKYIVPIFLIILMILSTIMIVVLIYEKIQPNNYFDRKDYIQNLETKLNIYEQEYDEFALKDAIEQGDSYE